VVALEQVVVIALLAHVFHADKVADPLRAPQVMRCL
jgi:hypothetical protein